MLRVYNTLTRQKEPFETVVADKVGMYLCGPTVYKPAHIGHMVGPVIFDVVKRYLTYAGYEVTFVVNITDIDDKLIHRAAEKGVAVESLAREMTADYLDNLATMGVDNIDHFPRATDHIGEMQAMISKLVETGHAYPLDGDVYFDVAQDDDYGKLSRRSVEEMMAGTRVEANQRKKTPADFALWKKSREGEPAWDSPWGPGRPGWHIECSAMSMKLLGESLDIHGGGLDLMFPHHENELAQSESHSGKPFARYWLHNGLMQAADSASKLGGAHDRQGDLADEQQAQEANKLAGSKGADSVKLLFESHAPETVRFFLLSTHYRSPILFSDERIAETGRSLEGFYRLFAACERATGRNFYTLEPAPPADDDEPLSPDNPADGEFLAEVGRMHERFLESMDDDFNTGGAIGVLFELRKAINSYMAGHGIDSSGRAQGQAAELLSTAMCTLKELAGILGVFRGPPVQPGGGADDEFVGGLMELLIALRSEARKDKNFAVADRIRDGLEVLKVTLEDRPDGTVWQRESTRLSH